MADDVIFFSLIFSLLSIVTAVRYGKISNTLHFATDIEENSNMPSVMIDKDHMMTSNRFKRSSDGNSNVTDSLSLGPFIHEVGYLNLNI